MAMRAKANVCWWVTIGAIKLESPRILKSAFLHEVALGTENTYNSGEDSGLKSLEEASRNSRDAQEELPRLPPVRLRSGDSKTTDISKDGLVGSNSKPSTKSGVFVNIGGSTEAAFGLGSFLDILVGQDVCSSGTRRLSGGSRPSVSQGIVEDVSERLSGFATAGDAQSESHVDYLDEYWDSDTYDDDDDPGYHRQPIEDEEWFLAHEIDYPDERSSPMETLS